MESWTSTTVFARAWVSPRRLSGRSPKAKVHYSSFYLLQIMAVFLKSLYFSACWIPIIKVAYALQYLGSTTGRGGHVRNNGSCLEWNHEYRLCLSPKLRAPTHLETKDSKRLPWIPITTSGGNRPLSGLGFGTSREKKQRELWDLYEE